MALIFLFCMMAMLTIALVVTVIIKQNNSSNKVVICTAVYTLLLTPSWAPATIVAIPMPFGMMMIIGIISDALADLLELLVLFWWWHIPAFIITGFVSYSVAIRTVGERSETQKST